MTAEAGLVVRQAQEAAQEAGCLFPLSFGGEGSATIGGVLSTNAGGNNTVRFGNARELMLGLEVVLPDGRVWDGLRALRKDNTGYALRHLFVGAEGHARDRHGGGAQAGAAAAPRRARPSVPCPTRRPRWRSSGASAPPTKAACGPSSTCPAPASRWSCATCRTPPCRWRRGPPTTPSSTSSPGGRTTRCASCAEEVLAAALEAGEISDAAVAANLAQQRGIWRLREDASEAQMREGDAVRNDVSVPVSRVPEFLREADGGLPRA